MPRDIKVYDLLISCPDDVSEYIDLIDKEINSFNNFYGRSNNIIIRSQHWSKNPFPEFGNQPQQLLDEQIVDNSDMAICIFWTRFGTSTEKYGSGTEEEIERMIFMGKQVFLYFLDKPVSPSKIDQLQYSKVQSFMDKNRGIFFVVPDEKTLISKF